MQHPKDVKGSDRPLPRNDGKFVLDGKRVEFSDYGGSSEKPKSLLSIPVGQRYTTIINRLDAIEKRLDSIMHGADVRNHRHYKLEEDYNRQLSKCAVTQATIKAIEEKLNGIN